MKISLCVLIGCATLAYGAVLNSDTKGWFVPQADGELRWVTREAHALDSAQIEPRAVTVRFLLYTKSNPNSPKQINIHDGGALSSSHFNKGHPTRFLIHGWKRDHTASVNSEVRSALLATGNYNVFVVDWSSAAMNPNYASARYSVGEVGRLVGNYIDFVNEKGGMSFGSLSIVGHSLGAHVAGFAGKNVRRGRVHTIIGLDPAMPLFNYNDCGARLCSSDANFVESIQTNGGVLGFLEPIGKAAFYANGGKIQPGCGVDLTGSCSHERAVAYYAESIRKNNFPSMKCSTWQNAVNNACGSSYSNVRMGAASNYGISGYYYVPVKSSPPFGMG